MRELRQRRPLKKLKERRNALIDLLGSARDSEIAGPPDRQSRKSIKPIDGMRGEKTRERSKAHLGRLRTNVPVRNIEIQKGEREVESLWMGRTGSRKPTYEGYILG